MRGYLIHARFVIAALAVLIGLLSPAPALAQVGASTLSGAATSWIGTPPPADCTVEVPSVDVIVNPLSTPVTPEDSAFPLTIPTETDLPAGVPADDAVVEAASATVWAALACLNGGDFPRFFACLSPQGIRSFYFGIVTMLGGEPSQLTEQDLADFRQEMTETMATPPAEVDDSEKARIDGIRDARILPDGKLLFVIDGALGADASMYMLFSLDGDRWLIDAFGQIGVFEETE